MSRVQGDMMTQFTANCSRQSLTPRSGAHPNNAQTQPLAFSITKTRSSGVSRPPVCLRRERAFQVMADHTW